MQSFEPVEAIRGWTNSPDHRVERMAIIAGLTSLPDGSDVKAEFRMETRTMLRPGVAATPSRWRRLAQSLSIPASSERTSWQSLSHRRRGTLWTKPPLPRCSRGKNHEMCLHSVQRRLDSVAIHIEIERDYMLSLWHPDPRSWSLSHRFSASTMILVGANLDSLEGGPQADNLMIGFGHHRGVLSVNIC
jgi:hypothetical protein